VSLRMIRALMLALLTSLSAMPLTAAINSGKISGVVVDPGGTPQMGATVLVSSERIFGETPAEVLTNDKGRFSTATLAPGMYSVKVTLAGFLPAMEQHVQVSDQHTTLLEVMLGSVFATFDKLRRQPNQELPADEWSWVLRSSPATRPVLRWQDGDIIFDQQPGQRDVAQHVAHRRMELTSGSDHPGSISNFADSPATAFAYELTIGERSKLVMAGQFSYEGASPAGGFITEWIPSGHLGEGPVTNLVVRESRLGPNGPTFRGMQLSHDNQLALGEHVNIRYGGEYLVAGFTGTTSSLRPRAEMAVRLAPGWVASLTVASRPWQDGSASQNEMLAALSDLDGFPTLLLRNGRPVLDGDLHEELAVEHVLNSNASLTAAIFHDRSSHSAVFGLGAVSGPDYLQDFFSDVFAYDAGGSSSSGLRVAYRQRIGGGLDTTFVYDYAGALAPIENASADASIREQLTTRYRQSLAARASTTIARSGTKFTASYKWIGGPVVSRQDAFGESMYHVDPFLSMEIRQPLPGIFSGRMEVVADVGNLLEQGYVPLSTGDGRVILVPSYRYFRGGLNFQF
jgi:hypothetical protein